MDEVLVNTAEWDAPVEIPAGWVIANAPRPIAGQLTWQGPFRRGIFYAASPEIPEGTFGWAADDAGLVNFITNEEITVRVLAKFAEYGYASADEAGVTIAEQAACMRLPYCG